MVLIKDVNDCETSAVRGLDQQLINEINAIVPNALVSIEDLNVAVTGASVWPLLQPPAKEALQLAINERGTTLQVNSAYRTIAAQLVLFQHAQAGRCGIIIAARPGESNHQSGLALDIEDNAGWRPFLERHGWRWLGPEDEVHFDFVGGGTQDLRSTAVLALQRLWNRSNPDARIAEDGQYGEQTNVRLGNSPAEGFALPDPDEPRPLPLGIYSLKCLGTIEGPRFLNGITAEARVDLAPSVGGSFSGTIWEITYDEAASAYRFRCQGNIEGARFLNGLTAEARVDLAPSAGGEFSGTNWEAAPVPDAPPSTYRFKCLGTIEGPRWLDGRTADGTVGLVDNIELSGTQWQAEPVPPTSPGPDIEKIVSAVPPELQEFARDSIPLILSEAEASGVTDRGQIAYILATAEHENGLGKYLEEIADGSQYEGREDLGNTQPGDGPRFKGRGFVQITGRNNYTDWSRRLGIDLVANPEKAAEPEIAAVILVQGMRDGTFTGAKLSDFINGASRDFVNARKIVNGLDKAEAIASIAERFFAVLT